MTDAQLIEHADVGSHAEPSLVMVADELNRRETEKLNGKLEMLTKVLVAFTAALVLLTGVLVYATWLLLNKG